MKRLAPAPSWQAGRFVLSLQRPLVMAVVNLTPDSFAVHADPGQALHMAQAQLEAGADVLDLGAESTRPGAQPVPAQVEWQRLQPVLREAVRWQVPVSVDTYKPEIMQRALDAGADIINDVWALRWRAPGQDNGLTVVAEHGSCGVCLMHMHGDPQTMQVSPMPDPVLPAVQAFLRTRAHALQAAGVAPERVVLDPGIGFGKTPAQNLTLLAQQAALEALGFPVLAGWSRKSTLGHITGQPVQARQAASVAAALLAVQRGAAVVRVHDVQATVDALRVWQAVQAAASNA